MLNNNPTLGYVVYTVSYSYELGKPQLLVWAEVQTLFEAEWEAWKFHKKYPHGDIETRIVKERIFF